MGQLRYVKKIWDGDNQPMKYIVIFIGSSNILMREIERDLLKGQRRDKKDNESETMVEA